MEMWNSERHELAAVDPLHVLQTAIDVYNIKYQTTISGWPGDQQCYRKLCTSKPILLFVNEFEPEHRTKADLSTLHDAI